MSPHQRLHTSGPRPTHLKLGFAFRCATSAVSSMMGPRAAFTRMPSDFIRFRRSLFIRCVVSASRLQCRLTTCVQKGSESAEVGESSGRFRDNCKTPHQAGFAVYCIDCTNAWGSKPHLGCLHHKNGFCEFWCVYAGKFLRHTVPPFYLPCDSSSMQQT